MKSVLGAWPFAITARARPFTIAAFICSSPMQPSTVLWTLFKQHRVVYNTDLYNTVVYNTVVYNTAVYNTEMFATQRCLQHRMVYNTELFTTQGPMQLHSAM